MLLVLKIIKHFVLGISVEHCFALYSHCAASHRDLQCVRELYGGPSGIKQMVPLNRILSMEGMFKLLDN